MLNAFDWVQDKERERVGEKKNETNFNRPFSRRLFMVQFNVGRNFAKIGRNFRKIGRKKP